jgi:predicted alpha/beta-fold hydrolase
MHDTYHAPVWLRWPGVTAGHAQTVLAATVTPCPRVNYRRERWTTPDDDFIDVDFVDSVNPTTPLVVLFHGLEGSSRSHYARALMYALQKRGWLGAVPHFRGCSGVANRLYRAYHSGDVAEIDWLVRRFAERHPDRTLYVAGVSLGGNAVLRWLGDKPEAAHRVARAVAVSAPLDLAAGGQALSRGLNHAVYTRLFLRTLKQKTLAKAQRHPGQLDAQALKRARDLYEFDNLYTAPAHGYLNTDDYWRRASAKPLLRHIDIPTLVLNARNDPFLPAQTLPHRHEVSTHVTLEQPEQGGHVGFVTGAFPGRIDWLPQRLLHFFEHG